MNKDQVLPDEYWVVALNGWTDAFLDVKQPPIWDFFHVGDRHFLKSSKFDDITDVSEILETATKLIDKINFAARRTASSRLHLSPQGTVAWVNKDGPMTQHILGGRLELGVSLFGDLAVGDEPAKVPTPIQEVLATVESPVVDLAAHFLNYPPGDPYWSYHLWKVYDVLKEDVTLTVMKTKGWTNNDQLWRFRTAVNDPTISGDQARHGVQMRTPHSNPMSRSEAEAFARDLFEKWVRETYDQQQTSKSPSAS